VCACARVTATKTFDFVSVFTYYIMKNVLNGPIGNKTKGQN